MNGIKLPRNKGVDAAKCKVKEGYDAYIAFFNVLCDDKLLFVVPIKFVAPRTTWQTDEMREYYRECQDFVLKCAREAVGDHPYYASREFKVTQHYVIIACQDVRDVRFDTNGHAPSLAHDAKVYAGNGEIDGNDATDYWYARGAYDHDVMNNFNESKHCIEAPSLRMLTAILEEFLQNGWRSYKDLEIGFVSCDQRPLWSITVVDHVRTIK